MRKFVENEWISSGAALAMLGSLAGCATLTNNNKTDPRTEQALAKIDQMRQDVCNALGATTREQCEMYVQQHLAKKRVSQAIAAKANTTEPIQLESVQEAADTDNKDATPQKTIEEQQNQLTPGQAEEQIQQQDKSMAEFITKLGFEMSQIGDSDRFFIHKKEWPAEKRIVLISRFNLNMDRSKIIATHVLYLPRTIQDKLFPPESSKNARSIESSHLIRWQERAEKERQARQVTPTGDLSTEQLKQLLEKISGL